VSAGEDGGKQEIGHALLSDYDVGNGSTYAVDFLCEIGQVKGCGSLFHWDDE
jgi:hypothetical protein